MVICVLTTPLKAERNSGCAKTASHEIYSSLEKDNHRTQECLGSIFSPSE